MIEKVQKQNVGLRLHLDAKKTNFLQTYYYNRFCSTLHGDIRSHDQGSISTKKGKKSVLIFLQNVQWIRMEVLFDLAQ